MDVTPIWTQIQYRIPDDLPRSVIRDITASPGLGYLDAELCETTPVGNDVRAPAVSTNAERDHRRMLEQQQGVWNPTRSTLLDERLLQRQRFGVRNNAEPANF